MTNVNAFNMHNHRMSYCVLLSPLVLTCVATLRVEILFFYPSCDLNVPLNAYFDTQQSMSF